MCIVARFIHVFFYVAHPHRRKLLRAIVDQPNNPILYSTASKLDMVYGKLNEFLVKENVGLDASQKNVLDQSRSFLDNKVNALDTNAWISLVGKILYSIQGRHF